MNTRPALTKSLWHYMTEEEQLMYIQCDLARLRKTLLLWEVEARLDNLVHFCNTGKFLD